MAMVLADLEDLQTNCTGCWSPSPKSGWPLLLYRVVEAARDFSSCSDNKPRRAFTFCAFLRLSYRHAAPILSLVHLSVSHLSDIHLLLHLALPSTSIHPVSLSPSCIISTSHLFGCQSQSTKLSPN
jgi:hypothetical protein